MENTVAFMNQRVIHCLCTVFDYGCKCVKQYGLIANGRGQVYQDFPCVRNMNCCFVHCAAIKNMDHLVYCMWI